MEFENLKDAYGITCTYFENEREDEPSMTFALESWISIAHTDAGEALVWANVVKIILRPDLGCILYVAPGPLVCSRKHRIASVPKDGFTFGHVNWTNREDGSVPQPDDQDHYLELFHMALALLDYKAGRKAVGFKVVVSEEPPSTQAVIRAAGNKRRGRNPLAEDQ